MQNERVPIFHKDGLHVACAMPDLRNYRQCKCTSMFLVIDSAPQGCTYRSINVCRLPTPWTTPRSPSIPSRVVNIRLGQSWWPFEERTPISRNPSMLCCKNIQSLRTQNQSSPHLSKYTCIRVGIRNCAPTLTMVYEYCTSQQTPWTTGAWTKKKTYHQTVTNRHHVVNHRWWWSRSYRGSIRYSLPPEICGK